MFVSFTSCAVQDQGEMSTMAFLVIPAFGFALFFFCVFLKFCIFYAIKNKFHFLFFKSWMTWSAANLPGVPITPPPGCAPAPQMYKPFTGVCGKGGKCSCWLLAFHEENGRDKYNWSKLIAPWKIFFKNKGHKKKSIYDVQNIKEIISYPSG